MTGIRSRPDLINVINTCDWKDGSYALHIAVENRHAGIVTALVEMGANVNLLQSPHKYYPTTRPRTPVELSIQQPTNVNISDRIISYFLSIPLANFDRAFDCAIYRQNPLPDDILCQLVQRCPPHFDFVSQNHATSKLSFAVRNRQHATVQALFARRAIHPPERADGIGGFSNWEPLLLTAAKNHDVEMTKIIIKAGVCAEPDKDILLHHIYNGRTLGRYIPSLLEQWFVNGLHAGDEGFCIALQETNLATMTVVLRNTHYTTKKYNQFIATHPKFKKESARPERKFLSNTYATHMIESPTEETLSCKEAHTMIDHEAAACAAHDLIILGHDPHVFVESHSTRSLLREARMPWSQQRHGYLFSRRFRLHIRWIVTAQYLTSVCVPYELFHLIMSYTPRKGMHDIITPDRQRTRHYLPPLQDLQDWRDTLP